MKENWSDSELKGGWFRVARKVFYSKVWGKPPDYLKLWIWLLGKASFTDRVGLARGELLTTYREMQAALAYKEKRKLIPCSKKKIRLILSWLVTEEMIGADPAGKAGLRISIKDFDYQDLNRQRNELGQDLGHGLGHTPESVTNQRY